MYGFQFYNYYYFRGEVVANAEEDETIAYGDVDLDYLDQVRSSIPISKQKRLQLYKPATPVT